MANLKKQQEEVIASIDTAKAIVDKIVSIMEITLVNPSLSKTFARNPIEFLLQLLKELGITYEDIRLFLTNFLVYILPALEISVKAILLTNLKNMISCSVDPRIPERYRHQHRNPNNPNDPQGYGIDINIESIDFLDKLSVNPLGEYGSNMYFGLEGVEDSYKLARADDMDAFLWFVIHKGKFPNSAKITEVSDLTNDVHGNVAESVTPSDGTLLDVLEVTYNKDNASSILPGNTFTYTGNSRIVSMCYDRKLDDADNIVHNTLVPVSDDWASVNWYARRADQLGKNLGFGWGVNQETSNTYYKGKMSLKNGSTKGRDFTRERAICNIQYLDQSYGDVNSPLTGLVNNKFRFTILPKPTVHIPDVEQGEPPWRFIRLLFDSKGNYDPNGKYSIDAQDSKADTYADGAVTIERKSGNVTTNPQKLIPQLVECYPGLTVFEFNYDYVMSIKLFDAKVLITSLIDSLVNARMGLSLGLEIEHKDATEALKEIIKNIINTDDSEINDCYYTFDNSKYESLLRKAEEKRARQERFGNVTHETSIFNSVKEILDEYDTNADLHEQVDILHRAITQAAVTVSDGVGEADKIKVEYDFVFDLIENLVTAIVNGILSPKVLMLLEVNQKIMGGTWEKFTMRDLLSAMQTIIVAIVKEVRDLIVQELLKLVMKELQPLVETIGSMILREQLENYAEAITDIIRNCPVIWFRFGNEYEDTKLDTVDYADIEVAHNKEGEQPSTNKC